MPKLLQINVCSATLSTGKIAEGISTVAVKHGWETYIAWGRYAGPSISHQIKVGGKLDIYIHYAAHRFIDCEGLASKKATRQLIQNVELINPDIVHLHNIHDHYLNYPMLFDYFSKAGIPLVWTQHDCWAFTGGCMYYDLYKCEKWKNGCSGCPEHRAYLCNMSVWHYSTKRRILSEIKDITYVAVSKWLESALHESHQKFRTISTIYNGIDISLFKPIHNKSLYNKNIILGVAAVWDRRKGLKDFFQIRIFLPKDDYDIVLVGLTQRQIKNLPDGIKGIARTTNSEELVKLYTKADVYVNPTYSDNFPTTNIEALACGTPVITYRTGGSPEAIDENTGAVIEQGNVDALCAKIIEFQSLGFKQKHSADCRKRAETYFDKDKCFEKYIELYESILQQKNR